MEIQWFTPVDQVSLIEPKSQGKRGDVSWTIPSIDYIYKFQNTIHINNQFLVPRRIITATMSPRS